MFDMASGAGTSSDDTRRVEFLILGAGWTSTFLLPLLSSEKISYTATSTTGRDGTIPFRFDPESKDEAAYKSLPLATTILITFPLKGAEQSHRLVENYCRAHNISIPKVGGSTTSSESKSLPHWVQLGSTGAYTAPAWNDNKSPVDESNARVVAEIALLALLPQNSCILNLAGLYGGTRQPRNWLSRVAKSRADAKAKGALHLVHGNDVARAIVAAHRKWATVAGSRWIITDCHVYDWWEVFWELGPVSSGEVEGVSWREAVAGFMLEDGVRALPRDTGRLGRLLDGTEFWRGIGVQPFMGRAWAVDEKEAGETKI